MDGVSVARRRNLGRQLRAFWGTLAAIALLGAGVAYGVTRYAQSDLERDATRDARKLALEVVQPALVPTDASSPIRGARYDQLLAFMQERVLAGPINRVRIWGADGTILFADDPSLVGRREPEMRDDIHSVISGTAQGVVEGDRYRTLTSVRVGEPPVVLAVELDRSHAAIVAHARDRWYVWVTRGAQAAGVFAALYVATALSFGMLVAFARRRRATDRHDPAQNGRSKKASKTADQKQDPELPAYMQPGFRDRVEAERRAEETLAAAERERRLAERASRLELEEARGRPPAEEDPSQPVAPTT